VLLSTGGWLSAIGGQLYQRDYPIVVHNIPEGLSNTELKEKIQNQNEKEILGLFINYIQPIGKKGTYKISLRDPTQANRLIQQGLVLDYEIKRVFQYKPQQRCQICRQTGHQKEKCLKGQGLTKRQGKTFYKEVQTPITTLFSASQPPQEPISIDIDLIQETQEEWTLIEGT
jgi:hypothetical protein